MISLDVLKIDQSFSKFIKKVSEKGKDFSSKKIYLDELKTKMNVMKNIKQYCIIYLNYRKYLNKTKLSSLKRK